MAALVANERQLDNFDWSRNSSETTGNSEGTLFLRRGKNGNSLKTRVVMKQVIQSTPYKKPSLIKSSVNQMDNTRLLN